MSNVSIYATDLSIGYGHRVVRSSLTFSLMEGEMVCLLGPNGSGKSTLLRTLAGLQPALGGQCNLTGLTIEERAKQLSLVLTERLSMEQTRVFDVVAMGRYPYVSFLARLGEEDEAIVRRSLEAVGLAHKSDDYFNQLSDGEKQRILIAKSLAQETPVILLDEPTAHLDLPGRVQTLRLLRELAHTEKKTILISTHELDLALRLSDRILLMSSDGLLLAPAEQLIRENAFTRAFGMDVFHEIPV